MVPRFNLVLMAIVISISAANAAELGSIGTRPTVAVAVDSNGDGIKDTAVIGTLFGAKSYGLFSGMDVPDVNDVASIVVVDFNKDGIEEAVIIGDRIVAIGQSGELWRKLEKGSAGTAADIDGNGIKEAVIGGFKTVEAFNSNGTSKWKYTDDQGFTVGYIVALNNIIIVGYKARSTLFALNFNGERIWSSFVPDNIAGMAAIDLTGSGRLDGVVVASSDGSVSAFNEFGGNQNWNYKDTIVDQNELGVNVIAIDKNSKGKLDHAVVNFDRRVHWVNKVTKIQLGITKSKALTALDLDGDRILDDVAVATEGVDSRGEIRIYNGLSFEIGRINETGGVVMTAIDIDNDGKMDDLVVASDLDKKVYLYILGIQDFTTSTIQTTAPPQTTPPPQTTAPPLTTAPPQTTPPPQTTAPPQLAQMIVNAGPDVTVLEGTPVTLTATVTTSRPDASVISYQWTEDGRILGNTPSIAVSLPTGAYQVTLTVIENTGAQASDTVLMNVLSSGGALPTLPSFDYRQYLGYAKWVILAGVVLFILIYIREIILDFLWERRRDGME